VTAVIDLASQCFASLNGVFKNAWILGATSSIVDTSVEDWDRTIAVHLLGALLGRSMLLA
jgi:NAD(P)-dependent dehydrogenase (short-subunit alcohol dehydrogenase family)